MENSILVIAHTREAMDTSKSHTVASLSIYSIIVRNTDIIHIIIYSKLQITRPGYYWRHLSYTSDWAINKKNSSCRRLFILILLGINIGNSPFLVENSQHIQTLMTKNLSKWFLFLKWCLVKNLCHSLLATNKQCPS